jgi:hypothetical protein
MKIRIPNTQKIFEFWGPRLGFRATEFYAIYVWATFAMLPIGVALFIAIGIAASSQNRVAWAVAYAVIVTAFVTLAAMFVTPPLARRAASRTLGLKVNRRNHPPRETVEYERWCVANGLQPFSADEHG